MNRVTEAIHNHHRQLLRTLAERTAAAAGGAEADIDAVLEFLRGDLLPHAFGEERHLYPLVNSLVRAHGMATATMSVDHECIQSYSRRIGDCVRELKACAPERRPGLHRQLERLMIQLQAIVQLHMEKEERVYLPLLERYSSEQQQKRALEQMHAAYEGKNGESTQLCAHRGAEPVLDVRTLVPAEHHRLIFETFNALQEGEAFILVNDHDPKPLYYQFKAEREGEFIWEYLERGPQVYRVRVGRVAGGFPLFV